MTKNETMAKHSVFLENREKMTITGVTDVKSFSDNGVLLKTCRGAFAIQGKGLNISRLNTDTGELFVSGEISLMKYSNEKNKGSLFEGLFK